MRLFFIITVLTTAFWGASCSNAELVSITLENSTKPTPQDNIKSLTEVQAIESAEKFIERNGYTDLPPDKEKLSYESIEWESNVDELLKIRHDTLERKAFGILHHRKSGSAGWTVAFRYKKFSSKNGRAVTMNLDGSDARVEHVEIILKKVGKKL